MLGRRPMTSRSCTTFFRRGTMRSGKQSTSGPHNEACQDRMEWELMKTPEGGTRKIIEEARREEELDKNIEQEDARIQAQQEHRPYLASGAPAAAATEQCPYLASEAPAAAAAGDAAHPAENVDQSTVLPTVNKMMLV